MTRTFGGTPVEEGSACRRDLCLTKHNTHNRQTSMPTVRFEPAIPASEWPQTYALDRAATGIGFYLLEPNILFSTLFYTPSVLQNLKLVLHVVLFVRVIRDVLYLDIGQCPAYKYCILIGVLSVSQ
jgi:hypothetical protein